MDDLRDNLIITLNSSSNTAADIGITGSSISSISLTNYRALATVVFSSQDQISYIARQTIRDNQFLQQTITSQQINLAFDTQYNVRMSDNQEYYLLI